MTGEHSSAAGSVPQGRFYPYAVLAVLTLAFTSNFLDRQILSILAEPVRLELGLSDTQLGLLSGPTFALFYTLFGIPIGWMSDRTHRVRLIAAACALWSLFSITCGWAQNFAQLALARVGVAIGEAGGSPPSHSLISDYFPAAKRGMALAILSSGVALGPALGAAVGGSIAAHYGWRAAFLAIGLPGFLIALLCLVVIREPPRGRLDLARRDGPQPMRLGAIIRAFIARRALVLVAVSTALSAFVGYSFASWNATLLIRVKGMTMSEVALYYSLVSGLATGIGTIASGWLTDRLARRTPGAYALVPGAALLVAVPFFVAGVLVPQWWLALPLLAIPSLAGNTFLAPALAVVQNLTPPERRATHSALLLFALNFVGLGGGPLYVGFASDLAPRNLGIAPLQFGLLCLVPMFLLAVLAHFFSARALAREPALVRSLSDSSRE